MPELGNIRPDLNGTEIMEVLGIPPGPLVGQASRFLLELRIEHGPLGRDRAVHELRRWAEAEGLDVPGPPDIPPSERLRPAIQEPAAATANPADDLRVDPHPAQIQALGRLTG